MKSPPLLDEATSPGRQSPTQVPPGDNRNLRFPFSIDRVEVWWLVVTEIHGDYDSVERADPRHRFNVVAPSDRNRSPDMGTAGQKGCDGPVLA